MCRGCTAFCNGPHAVCGLVVSLNKPTSYLILCVSFNSFCNETSRTWASLGPKTRSVISVGGPELEEFSFDWVQRPTTWVQLPSRVFGWAPILVVQMVKNTPAMQETQVQSVGWEDPLEKGTATHSNILAWRIKRTEEPGRLQSMGSHRAGHYWVTNT